LNSHVAVIHKNKHNVTSSSEKFVQPCFEVNVSYILTQCE